MYNVHFEQNRQKSEEERMAAIHNEDIKDLLSVIPIIPDKLMIEYLMAPV